MNDFIEQPCAHCGAPFTPKHSREVCCSEGCKVERKRGQIRAAAIKNLKGIPPLDCVECGTPFQPATANQLTCSSACRDTRNLARANAQQATLRQAKGQVEIARQMTNDCASGMLMATDLDELEYMFASSMTGTVAALKKLYRAKRSELIKASPEAAQDAINAATSELQALLLAAHGAHA